LPQINPKQKVFNRKHFNFRLTQQISPPLFQKAQQPKICLSRSLSNFPSSWENTKSGNKVYK
jgi:hypothetical protein